MRAKVYKTGGNSPWEDTFNGLVQEPNCVLASDGTRSIGLPSKKVFDSNMRTNKAEKSRHLAGVIKEKESNKYENQVEVL